MALDGRRPQRRRRRWLFFALVLTLLVLAVNAAVSSRSTGPALRQATLAYGDGARPLVDRSTQQGADLVDVRSQAVGLGRDGIDRRLDRISRDANQVLHDGRQLRPPSTLRDVHDLLMATFAIRAQAAVAMRQAMSDALGPKPSTDVVGELATVGRDITAADQAYTLVLAGLPKDITALPASQWVADAAPWTEPMLGVFVTSLRSSAALSPVHDVTVVLVTIDPAAVGTDGANAVLPQAKNLRLQIVVANVGNEAERHVAVTATVAPAGIGPTDTARDWVDLEPGQRRTILLGTLRPALNAPSTLTVHLDAVGGEANIADNDKTITYVMR
ncbi:MAG: hypothetical protein QOG64_810 [Acidimicrobiaceae bacterium]|nr:hypothetical protein [Acidimicrobiaceae bacterium]